MSIKQISRKIIWSVPGISTEAIKNLECGHEIESREFEINFGRNRTKWFLKCYPNGVTEDKKGNVGIFLRLVAADFEDFDISYSVSLLGKNQNKMHERGKIDDSTLICLKIGFGYQDLISHQKLLEDSDLLFVNEKLTIVCEMTIKYTATKHPEVSPVSPIFKNMFEDEIFTDFQIKTNDNVILKAHKAVLVVRSPFCREWLLDSEDSQDAVELDKYDSNTMRHALRWIYTNEVNDLDEVAEKLAYVADKYELEDLKQICYDNLVKNLSIENVLRAVVVGEKLSEATDLYEKSMDFMKNNYHHIVNTDAWTQLEPLDFKIKILAEVHSRSQGNAIFL